MYLIFLLLVLELLITLSSGENDVHPDSHGFGRRCHQVIGSFKSLHDKSDLWIGRLDGVHVINVHFFNGLLTTTTKKKSSNICSASAL